MPRISARFRSVLFSIALFATFLSACGTRTTRMAPRERKGRIIVLTDAIAATGGTDTIRFGRLRSGEIAVQRLWIENASQHPVAFVSYARSCGCTTLEFDSQPLIPGESREVSLTFDSRGEHGWQLKTLDIALAGTNRPLRLFIEADVE